MNKNILALVRLSRYWLRRIREEEHAGREAMNHRVMLHRTLRILFHKLLDKGGISGKIKIHNQQNDGGPGSGNWGHQGVKGQRGGSAPRNGSQLKGIGLRFFGEGAIKGQTSAMLRRGIRTFEKRIAEHEGYLKVPQSHAPEWDTYSSDHQESLKKHWRREIQNFQNCIDERVRELKERGDYP